jgi:uncharacterized protein involved in exopolysaccharide biosynthesis
MPPIQQQQELGFSLGDLAAVFRRRIAWFLTPTVVGLLCALLIALLIPPVYEAETTILIEPSTVRDEFVRSTVVSDKEARFEQTRLRLLARDALANIIQKKDHQLYADEALAMELKVERMREEVTIEPILPAIVDPRKEIQVDSVRIAFRHDNPGKAASVANDLAREFIRINIEARNADAQGTSDFLAAELAREETELAKILAEISDYKEKHDGELPEQLPQNRMTLDRLTRELADKQAALESARAQVSLIQRELLAMRTGGDTENTPVRRKQTIEAMLASLRANGLTDKHPDVIAQTAELAEIEKLIAASAGSEEGSTSAISPTESRVLQEQRDNQVKVNVLSLDVERVSDEIATYEARIAATPKHQAELGQLEARAIAHERAIQDFRQKKALADMAKSLEAKQRGERYRVIESAEVPETPVEPNRPLVFAIGAILGLIAGIAALVIRELTDQRVASLAELQAAIPLPVLGSVSLIRLPAEIAEMRARIRRWSLGGAAAAVVMLIVGSAVWFFATRPPAPTTPEEAPAAEARQG